MRKLGLILFALLVCVCGTNAQNLQKKETVSLYSFLSKKVQYPSQEYQDSLISSIVFARIKYGNKGKIDSLSLSNESAFGKEVRKAVLMTDNLKEGIRNKTVIVIVLFLTVGDNVDNVKLNYWSELAMLNKWQKEELIEVAFLKPITVLGYPKQH